MIATRQIEQLNARERFQRRAICDSENTLLHAFVDNEIEEVKAVAVDKLIILIVADKRPAEIRGDDTGWAQTQVSIAGDKIGGEGAFTTARDTTQHKQCATRQMQRKCLLSTRGRGRLALVVHVILTLRVNCSILLVL